ncbi:MAG: hypothetical protein CMF74_17945 [Maricaulis sp.]|nr:hypothetical protein [Maricaulis sp.]
MTQPLKDTLEKTSDSVKDGQIWAVKFTYILKIILHTWVNILIVVDFGMTCTKVVDLLNLLTIAKKSNKV